MIKVLGFSRVSHRLLYLKENIFRKGLPESRLLQTHKAYNLIKPVGQNITLKNLVLWLTSQTEWCTYVPSIILINKLSVITVKFHSLKQQFFIAEKTQIWIYMENKYPSFISSLKAMYKAWAKSIKFWQREERETIPPQQSPRVKVTKLSHFAKRFSQLHAVSVCIYSF